MAFSQSPLNSMLAPGKTLDSGTLNSGSSGIKPINAEQGETPNASFKDTLNKTQNETRRYPSNERASAAETEETNQHSESVESDARIESIDKSAGPETEALSTDVASGEGVDVVVAKLPDTSTLEVPSGMLSDVMKGQLDSPADLNTKPNEDGLPPVSILSNKTLSGEPPGEIKGQTTQPVHAEKVEAGLSLDAGTVSAESTDYLPFKAAHLPASDLPGNKHSGEAADLVTLEGNPSSRTLQPEALMAAGSKPLPETLPDVSNLEGLAPPFSERPIESLSTEQIKPSLVGSNGSEHREVIFGRSTFVKESDEGKVKAKGFLDVTKITDVNTSVKPIAESAAAAPAINKVAALNLSQNSAASFVEKLMPEQKLELQNTRTQGFELVKGESPASTTGVPQQSASPYVNGVRVMETGPVSIPAQVRFGSEQWQQNIAERTAMLVSQQIKSAEIQLDPPELGPLSVKIHVHNDQAVVNFVSANANVRDALDQSLLRLRDMLQEQGMDLVDAGVSGQERDGANDEKQQEEFANSGGALQDDIEEPTSQQPVTLNSGIDYFA